LAVWLIYFGDLNLILRAHFSGLAACFGLAVWPPQGASVGLPICLVWPVLAWATYFAWSRLSWPVYTFCVGTTVSWGALVPFLVSLMGWTGRFGLDHLVLADDLSFLADSLGLANLMTGATSLLTD
jgi:hypothetical protein